MGTVLNEYKRRYGNIVTEEDYEDDEDLLLEDMPGVCFCSKCEGEIRLTEEIFIVRFARPYLDDKGMLVTQEYTPEGRDIEEPHVYCFGCWEDIREDAQIATEDEPPYEVKEAITECYICKSSICAGETMALEVYGEFHTSKRRPNNQPSVVFETNAEPNHVCLDCVTQMDFDHIRPNFIDSIEVVDHDGFNTCEPGIRRRCWQDRSRCTHCPLK